MSTLSQAIESALVQRGLGDLWWGAKVLDAWPHVVGCRYAEAAKPILERSPLREKGLLTVAVRNSAWMQELSFLNITERLNYVLGQPVVRTVRFELREVLP